MSEMKEKKVTFGRIFWPSLVAMLIASILGLILFFLMLGGVIVGLTETPSYSIKDKTILHMSLKGQIAENSSSTFNPA